MPKKEIEPKFDQDSRSTTGLQEMGRGKKLNTEMQSIKLKMWVTSGNHREEKMENYTLKEIKDITTK